MSGEELTRLGEDIRWDIGIGIRMAVFYTIIAAVVTFFRQESNGLPLIVAGYAVAGIVSGVLLGLFRKPAGSSRVAAILLGIVIAFPAVYIMAEVVFMLRPGLAEEDPAVVAFSKWGTVIIVSVWLGAFGGWYFGPGGPGHPDHHDA